MTPTKTQTPTQTPAARAATCAPPRPPARGGAEPLLRIGVTSLGGGDLGHGVLLALAARCPATAAGLTLAPPHLMWTMLCAGGVDAVLVAGEPCGPAPDGTVVGAVTGGAAAVVAAACPPAARLVLRHLVEDLGWAAVGGWRP